MGKERPLQSMAIVIGPCWMKFLFTKIKEEDIGNIWFQQEGATCHTADATFNVLRLVFEDRIICRKAEFVWTSRSCDLTSLDYYLWGAVKKRDNWRFKGPYSWSHWWNTAAHIDNVLKNRTDRVKLFPIINWKDCTFK